MTQTVYLDHNATTPLRDEAARAMSSVMAGLADGTYANPSSVHTAGRAARKVMEDARDDVAALLGTSAQNVIFTSGGTEANNQALRETQCRRVLCSAVEHPSVRDVVEDCEIIPVDANGVVQLDALQAMLASGGSDALVSIMLANNETGAIQPIDAVVRIAQNEGARVHVDAVQAAGKIAVNFDALGCDLLSISAHKLGGPAGVGALLTHPTMRIGALVRGGGQAGGLRSGTENLVGIAGFGAAAQAALAGLAAFDALRALRDDMERVLCKQTPGLRPLSVNVARLPNTSLLVGGPGSGNARVMSLDLEGIAISAGSACSSGAVKASPVLGAMGVDPAQAKTAVRISLGWNTQQADIDTLIAAWSKIINKAAA